MKFICVYQKLLKKYTKVSFQQNLKLNDKLKKVLNLAHSKHWKQWFKNLKYLYTIIYYVYKQEKILWLKFKNFQKFLSFFCTRFWNFWKISICLLFNNYFRFKWKVLKIKHKVKRFLCVYIEF